LYYVCIKFLAENYLIFFSLKFLYKMADFVNTQTDVINLYTTVEQCDDATVVIQEELDEVIYDMLVLAHKSSSAIDGSSKTEADLEATITTRNSYQTIVDGLPVNSPLLPQFEGEVTKLNYKIFNLENKAARQGSSALMRFTVKNDGLQQNHDDFSDILANIVIKRATL